MCAFSPSTHSPGESASFLPIGRDQYLFVPVPRGETTIPCAGGNSNTSEKGVRGETFVHSVKIWCSPSMEGSRGTSPEAFSAFTSEAKKKMFPARAW